MPEKQHKQPVEIEGDEAADPYAKLAAELPRDTVDWEHLREASLAPLARGTTEARSQPTKEWVGAYAKGRRR